MPSITLQFPNHLVAVFDIQDVQYSKGDTVTLDGVDYIIQNIQHKMVMREAGYMARVGVVAVLVETPKAAPTVVSATKPSVV
jgi:hypothetical protein